METKRLQVPVIGLRRSGKSSILNVVYNELHPDDTVFLESTTKPSFILSDSFLPIRIIDTPSRVLLGDVRLEKGIPLSAATGARAGPPPPVPARNAPAPTQLHNGAAASGGAGNTASGSAAGSIAANTPELLAWTDVSAVVFVIDSQDDYYEALSKLQTIILSAFAENQTIEFHVFVHKIDGYSNDYRQDTLSTIQGKVLDDLVDSSPSFIAQAWSYPEPLPAAKEAKSSSKKDRSRSKSKDLSFSRSPAAVGGGNSSSGGGGYDASASEFSSFSGGGYRSDVAPEPGLINLDQAVRLHCHATSIYDTSVFVAISKLQQSLAHKVKPEEPLEAENITALSNGAGAAQAASTDGEGNGKPTRPAAATLRRNLSLAESMEQVCDSICSTCKFENAFLFDLPTRTYIGSDSAPFDAASFDLVFDYAGFLAKFAGLYAGVQSDSSTTGSSQQQTSSAASGSSSTFQLSTSPSSARRFLLGRISKETSKPATDASAATPTKSNAPAVQRWASSVTRLQPDQSLCFWQINHRLALIALMHSDVHAKQTGLIEYNITFFRRAVQGLYGLAQTST
ncbi:related to Ras-like G protein RagD [Sporisorium scitamineum]|uniref:Related to Ras-like G protein RagD n=1 Tax=Sporisorium scitamineum TaxID=49012 RepID=A0A0F7S922_9BASI|nr:related to Ras-like G protein RagD [Sporisorium scitamineum]CDW99392.1 hypothetical protein [Sporisorium scitamineum]